LKAFQFSGIRSLNDLEMMEIKKGNIDILSPKLNSNKVTAKPVEEKDEKEKRHIEEYLIKQRK